MTMTERRTIKTQLIKQSEIEENEESASDETNGSPNSDVSDATITANIPVCIQSASDSPENGSPEESGTSECIDKERKEKPRSNNASAKLKREVALCDDVTPPPERADSFEGESPAYETPTSYDTLVIPNNIKLEKQGSQGSETSASPCLSRDSSLDSTYKDSTGIDLVEFIRKTLNKSVKDKKMLLQLEKDFKKFIKEPKHQYLQLPDMSSYDRMLVHRIAAFFGLDHNVDQRGKSVIVSKTKKTRVPDLVFEDYVLKGGELQPKRQILPRKVPSMDETHSAGLQKPHIGNNRAKSLEERQKSYDEHKARIFNGESGQDEAGPLRSSKCSLLSSKDDLTVRHWSSTDSSGYGTDNSNIVRGRLLPKANSYGGISSPHKLPNRTTSYSFSKADSFGSSHSGSFDTCLTRPPNAVATPPSYYGDTTSRSSSAGPIQSPLQVMPGQNHPLPLIVAPDFSSIPPGSLMINQQTMTPYKNPDGSYYHYDPNQPPPPWLSGVTGQPNSGMNYTSTIKQQSVESVGEICHKLQPMALTPQTPDNIEVHTLGTAPSSHPHTFMMSGHQAYPPQQQPSNQYVQNPYYPSQGVAGQPVRYVYPMTYASPNQGECHNHANSTQIVGQYSQQFVSGYPNYQNVVHQGTPQASEMPPVSYQPAPMYPVSHTDNMSSYSIQYAPHSQQNFGQQSHSPVYYSVSQTASPQMAFTITGQNSLRAATPPSQPSANIPNPNIAINVGQPLGYAQQGSTSGGQQFTSYQPYPHQFPNQPRPINQVIQLPGLQSQTPPQGVSVIRPSMPINMQPGGMVPNNVGQTLAAKGYQMTSCVHKSGYMGDGGKDGGVTLIPTGGGVPATSPITPTVIQHLQCTGDYRMVAPAGVRPQLQPLQFTSKPQQTQSQVPKTRPVVPSVSIRAPRPRKPVRSTSKEATTPSSGASPSADNASNQNA
ncbi:cAMP-regulated phosphoprotein 21 isoform X2 [Patella vulgata]|uniref:cAMP-regulated phosphoprotein 21 isoform X2 n=1 Tax=Patella vulgata TaxID=6465 RepID=UPI00217F28A4|nr:cAMP-regulated phosphoprotein 21 isoform X2 [Patella vulgata]